MKEVAKREAETIKQEAEADARRHIEELNNEIRRKEELLEDKKKQMQIYRIRVSSMLEAQLKILNEDELTKEELAKELLAAHDEVLKGNTIPFDQFYESLKKDLKL